MCVGWTHISQSDRREEERKTWSVEARRWSCIRRPGKQGKEGRAKTNRSMDLRGDEQIEAIMTMCFTFGTVELTEPWSLIDPDTFHLLQEDLATNNKCKKNVEVMDPHHLTLDQPRIHSELVGLTLLVLVSSTVRLSQPPARRASYGNCFAVYVDCNLGDRDRSYDEMDVGRSS
jgi:hypothetical protein